jgi:deazaflavin-dependent oxidoreductase (nitroreductase family)
VTRDEEIHDCPTGWVNQHIRGYVESGGARGHRWQGVTTLLITTRGRKTGKLRRTALIYGRDGDRYIIVASKGGAPTHPEWYLNLTANPAVDLQVGAEKFTARARTATPDEKPELWRLMNAVYAQYENYQARTTRDIPVVVLEPAGGG